MIMTNSRVLQFIIEELKNSPINWKDNRELFEIICYPTSFGQENEKKRQLAKKPILKLFKEYGSFNKKEFNFIANGIICNKNEQLQKEKLLSFLLENMEKFHIKFNNIESLINKIPCKNQNIKNYRSKFNYWRNKYCEIQDENIKKCIQINFNFQSDLWSSCEAYQKDNLREGIKKFIRQYLEESLADIFIKVDGVKDNLNNKELKGLFKIRDMNQNDIIKYIDQNRPLSQIFILKLISLLYDKGYYKLLLKEGIEVLKPSVYDDIKIKKLHAKVLGSSKIRRYKEAHDVLKSIEIDCRRQLINIQTEAISNRRRYKLLEFSTNREEKRKILQDLFFHYQQAFQENKIYHYYPGINLAYIVAISKIIFDTKDQQLENISSIFKKSKKSIMQDKNNKNYKVKYYASITNIEFKILQSLDISLFELKTLLEKNSGSIPKIGLEKTQRQMKFFVDILVSFQVHEHKTLFLMKNAIDIIDNFMDEKDAYF